MTKLLLSLHVLAAIIAIGPVTVAASMFPAVARQATRTPGPRTAPAPVTRAESAPGTRAAPVPDTRAALASGDRTAFGSDARAASASGAGAESGSDARVESASGALPEAGSEAEGGERLRLLHRICRVYGVVGVAVPVFGLATASSLGVLGDTWLLTSIALTVAAALILSLLIVPGQRRALVDGRAGRLGMYTGIFNLLWATVTVLMIVRPGSTTGA
ncbi:membrane protein [Actinoplanes sichuanensis]|nr:membrane protein [Actinoplanes sichuanensis]